MKSVISLKGSNYDEDKRCIEENVRHGGVFVLDNEETKLWEYLDHMYEELGLSSRVMDRLKICSALRLAGDVSVIVEDGSPMQRPASMKELLEVLRPGTAFHVIIENDSRKLLADIVQQLVYLDYPITEGDIRLRQEYRDAARTERFMKNVESLKDGASKATTRLRELSLPSGGDAGELQQKRDEALSAFQEIEKQIKEALNVEMKISVAASKKTGKSVITNSLIGQELAPTSLDLPTPNTCIYCKSADNRYHLRYVDKDGSTKTDKSFDDARELYGAVSQAFRQADRDAEGSYSIPDMVISYVSNGNNFETYTIYDTPGPDLEGANHWESAERALQATDVALFGIDYSKHLIPSEVEYLEKVKEHFGRKGKFHSLIFVLNKVDLALANKGLKCRVRSVDYIRDKLTNLGSEFGECIIFATSAQDYFYTLELKRAAKDWPQIESLCEPNADLTEAMAVEEELEEKGCLDHDLLGLLSNVSGEAGRLRAQLGIRPTDTAALQEFSGMPQLEAYTKYIAQSRAREEIVNSITYTIDSQRARLQDLIDETANYEKLMRTAGDEIERISAERIQEFKARVDDRSSKQAECDGYQRIKELIEQIEEASSDFISTWDAVVLQKG